MNNQKINLETGQAVMNCSIQSFNEDYFNYQNIT